MSADMDHEVSALQRLARITGLLYLAIAVFGMVAPTVLQTLVLPGDAATTAHTIVGSRWVFGSSLVTWITLVVADAAVAVTLYLLLAPVSRALSLVAAAFRLVYAAIVGAGLINLFDAFLLLTSAERGAGLEPQQRQTLVLSSFATLSTGFLLALVFFGVHLLVLGVVLDRLRSVPRTCSARWPRAWPPAAVGRGARATAGSVRLWPGCWRWVSQPPVGWWPGAALRPARVQRSFWLHSAAEVDCWRGQAAAGPMTSYPHRGWPRSRARRPGRPRVPHAAHGGFRSPRADGRLPSHRHAPCA